MLARWLRLCDLIRRGYAHGNHQGERRADRGNAAHRHVAAELPGQALANCQAQPGSAGSVPQRGSDPVERLEQAGHLLGGHAYARIIDLEDQGSFGARAIHHAPGQTDAAAIGELDRIVDEIDEDLLEPQPIGGDELGRSASEHRFKLQVLGFRPGAERFHHIREDLR